MLYEIKNARKFDNDKPVRWFTDEYFDLTVWMDSVSGEIISFQVTYDKNRFPYALTWRNDKGFSHEKVDAGDNPGRHKRSPILLPNGKYNVSITERFIEESKEIDAAVRDFVCQKMKSFTVKTNDT